MTNNKWTPVKEKALFFRELICHPRQTSMLVPSSAALAEVMVVSDKINKAQTVVELGPGTGVFTGKIHELCSDKLFFAMELNSDFVAMLKSKMPTLKIYNDSAGNIKNYLNLHNTQKTDLVISSLPWASFSPRLQNKLLASIRRALSEGGEFITYSYVHTHLFPHTQKFKRILYRHFSEVTTSKIVWKNIPPAFAYYCKK